MNFVNIGFGNVISVSKVVAVVSPESAPIKRLITDAREDGILIDASFGRKTKSVIVMESGHIVLSSLEPETVGVKLQNDTDLASDKE